MWRTECVGNSYVKLGLRLSVERGQLWQLAVCEQLAGEWLGKGSIAFHIMQRFPGLVPTPASMLAAYTGFDTGTGTGWVGGGWVVHLATSEVWMSDTEGSGCDREVEYGQKGHCCCPEESD